MEACSLLARLPECEHLYGLILGLKKEFSEVAGLVAYDYKERN
jgi:hypothetical protein